MLQSDETKDGARTAENTPAIPMLQLVPARERSEEGSEQQVDSQEVRTAYCVIYRFLDTVQGRIAMIHVYSPRRYRDDILLMVSGV